MKKYDFVDCPICGKPLQDGTDIVVCPDCGAPYHRSCYLETGECIFTDLHEKGEEWKAPKKELPKDEHTNADGDENAVICGRCGAENDKSAVFCNTCGFPIIRRQDGENQSGEGFNPFVTENGETFNPFFNPLSQINMKEEIDGVATEDIVAYVGSNWGYFLPKFRMLSKNNTSILNWSAFFFQGGYFFYRKMYGLGIAIFLLTSLLGIPSSLMYMETLMGGESISAVIPWLTPELLANLNMITSFLVIGVRFVCGIFANKLYKKHVYGKINQIKSLKEEKGLDSDWYFAALKKKGSVATKQLTIILAIYLTLNLISMAILTFLPM